MVTVIGSLNVDYIACVERLPSAGETVPASTVLKRFGGKGANQAVAAARQGAEVHMLGCIGDDSEGRNYRDALAREGVLVRKIFRTPKAMTGMALIAVDERGENTIVVASGANGKLDPETIRANRKQIETSRLLLVQFEIPLNSVLEAIRIANRAGVTVVLNPSPLHGDFPFHRCRLDTLIVNEHEARVILGSKRVNTAVQLQKAKLDVENVIITRGAESTVVLDSKGRSEVPTLKVKPVDTVGAGDAFAGAYVARRAEGLDVLACVRYANCAGALATLKRGAQEAIPKRDETERAFWRFVREKKLTP